MQKIKNLAYLLMFSLVLFSCGEYQKVLNKGTTEDQYKMATKMYEVKITEKPCVYLRKLHLRIEVNHKWNVFSLW